MPTIDPTDHGGLLAEIVDWMVRGSLLPQPTLAIGNAVALLGALYGRRYRTDTDLRTNVYAIGTAPTGAGKERSRSAVKKLLVAAGMSDLLGGERLVSGSGLITAVHRAPRVLFQLDEFGDMLEAATSWRAAGYQAAILSDLMRLHSSSSSLFCGTEYADRRTARIDIAEPCACLWGTTTPAVLWQSLRSRRVLDGFLNRFVVFRGHPDPVRRSTPEGPVDPPENLVERFRAHDRMGTPTGIQGSMPGPEVAVGARLVPFTRSGIEDREHSIESFQDERLQAKSELHRAAWARAEEHMLRLALIRAVSRDPASPAIEEDDVAWGYMHTIASTVEILSGLDRYSAENEQEDASKRLLRLIETSGVEGLTKSQLTRQSRWLDARRRGSLLTDLEEGGLVTVERSKTGGRPRLAYVHSAFVSRNGTEPPQDDAAIEPDGSPLV